MKKYALFAVATLASIFAPSLCAYPSYPYPYEYKGASATGPWQYSADGGTSAGFAVPAGNIKNGELIGYSAGVTLPYKVSFDVNASITLGHYAGFVNETYKFSAFGESEQLDRQIWWRCDNFYTCGGSKQNDVSLPNPPIVGVASSNVPRFESYRSRGLVRQYESAITPFLGGTTATFSVESKKSNAEGEVVSFSNASTYTGGGGYQFRPWTTYDVLSGTTDPYISTANGHPGNTVVVDPTPWFGFTVEEAANLSGYDHFNWFSKIVQLGIGQVPGTGTPETFSPASNLTRVNTLFGRNFGPDPGIGCYNNVLDDCPKGLITDLSPLVYDENLDLLDGRLAIKWDDNKAKWGLRFTDSPNLVFKGLQAVYETTLVGVRSKGADNPADYDEFNGSTFRWSYTQLGDSPPPEPPFGGHGTVQPILFNTDPTKAGIGRIDLLGFGSFADYGLTVTGDIPNNDPIPFPESGGNGNNPGTGSGQSVSEPGALTLFLTGIVSLAFAVRRRRV
ncbi:MAG: hypothetical protein IPL99_18595 [Candidatus Competibacteraceae bacterium]|nr:hypothetical protein [Candidatus Competibacteraceae bacterium]